MPATRPFLVLNLDNTLTWQHRLLSLPHIRVDLTGLEGKKSCMAPATLARMEEALVPYRDVFLWFWGAGEYHYVTYVRLRSLRLPLTLVLLDHHHDCAPAQGGVITCGDWVRHALELPWVQRVVWIGGRRPELDNLHPHPRLWRVRHPAPPARFARWAARALPTAHVYLSIDKDVLSPADAVTQWGAGDLSLSDLLAWVKLILRHRRVTGIDVGGEWTVPPGRVVPPLEDWRAIRQNEAANLAILAAVAEPALPRGHDAPSRTG